MHEASKPAVNGEDLPREEKRSMSMIDMIRSPRQAVRQNWTLVKFVLVGMSGVLVNEIFLVGLTYFFGESRYLFANLVGLEISTINNFVWNDKYTFKKVREASGSGISAKLSRLGKYNVISLGSFVVNTVILYLLKTYVLQKPGFELVLSSLIAIAVAFVVNYIASSRWAWKDKTRQRSPSGATDAIK
jgi:putative flippase GtrA